MQEMAPYIAIAIAAVVAAASLFTLNLYLILIASSLAFTAFFLYKIWNVVEALIINKTGVIQVIGRYELEGSRMSAIKTTKGGFSSVSAALLRSFPTRELNRENVERIISNSNSPFRFVIQVKKLNTAKIIDDLKTRRRIKEIELSKAKSSKGADPAKVVEREIEIIENEISSISTGAIPLKTDIYLLTSAEADSKFIAQERSTSQIKELSGQFSAVLGAGFEPVSSSELVSLMQSDPTVIGV